MSRAIPNRTGRCATNVVTKTIRGEKIMNTNRVVRKVFALTLQS